MPSRDKYLLFIALVAIVAHNLVSSGVDLKSFVSVLSVSTSPEMKFGSNVASLGNLPTKSFQAFPTCRDGCVIFFLHIPKTGGTTLRKTLTSSGGVLHETARNLRSGTLYSWKNKMVPRFCEEHNKRILVMELHTNNAPSFQTLAGYGFMDKLRNTTKSCGLPFFAFTVMRDSVALDVSLFNHYCLRLKRCGDIQEPTVENLLQFHPGNPQCHFLKKWPEDNIIKKTNYSQEDCEGAYTLLNQHMDWIGTLERYNETIAVLEHVLQKNLRVISKNSAASRNEVALERHDLNDTVKRILQEDSAWDRSFYSRIQKDYTLDKIVSFRDYDTRL